jgi:hypothetical protein
VPVRIARSTLLLLNLGWLDGNALAATGVDGLEKLASLAEERAT